MLVMVSGPVPEFDSTTVCAALVVLKSWGENVRPTGATPATGAVPVPVRVMGAGLLTALFVSVRLPVSGPAVVGANVTSIVQLAFTARFAQLSVSANLALAETLPESGAE